MSTDNLHNVFQDHGCLPHQAEFAANFLAPDSARKHLLTSSPGLGKGFVASAIAGYVATHGQARRVLVFAPSALISQWHDMIRRGSPDAPFMVVDRRRFRELEANQAAGDSLWPASGIILMSIDFARRPDVAESLIQTAWDFLVVDEAQHLTPKTQRHRVVSGLLDQSPNMRVLLLRVNTLMTAPDGDVSEDPLFCDAAKTVWSRETVRDKDGRPLLPEVLIEWIAHHRRDDEVKLLSRLQDVLQATRGSGSQSQFEATILLQTASSSLFALEQRLNRMRRRRNEIAHGIGDDDLFIDELGIEEPAGAQSLAQSKFIDETGELLEMLDNVDSDSKCEALISLLDSIGVLTSSDRRVCVFTSYVDTATYLESALSEHHPRVSTITGRLSAAERQQVVEEFAQNGGILVTTSAMSTPLPEVAAVIFYDLPLNPATIDARIGQFIRVGRRGPVRIFAFTDESNALIIERLQRKAAETKQALGEGEVQQLLFPEKDT